jgi:hypothetical protein
VVSPFDANTIYYIKEELYTPAHEDYNESIHYYLRDENFYLQNSNLYPWAKDIYEAPEKLVFWLDFLDLGGDLNKYGV